MSRVVFTEFFIIFIVPAVDTSKIKLEDDEDDRDLQLALHRTRKLQQAETLMSSMVKVRKILTSLKIFLSDELVFNFSRYSFA